MEPSGVDRQTFLDNLRRSGLVGSRDLESIARRLPATDRGEDAARRLVRAGVLTRFQARLVLAGKVKGFLLGQYRILDQVGKGGMGRVYKAVHRTMKRVVALKVLAPELVRTEKARRLFKHEVRAAARLLHPNIVTAYDANKVGRSYFLVMEYVDGLTLDQLVRRRGPMSVSLACEVVRQAAVGLHYAHHTGMLHRDVKPSNLMVTRAGPGAPGPAVQVKILDFGLARLHEVTDAALAGSGTIPTAPNTVLGTPDYLSPEQSRSLHGTDVRSDLYSLGCTFYYVLSGKVPFPGGTSVEKMLRHINEEPTPLEGHRPDLPAAVAALVRRLMAKDPAARFQTAAELAEALAPFCQLSPASGMALHRAMEQPPTGAPAEGRDSSAVELGATPPAADVISGSTWPPDLAPTPLSGDVLPGTAPAAGAEAPPRRGRTLLWAAAAAAVFAAGAAGLFLALQ